jgi:hypothetical protein
LLSDLEHFARRQLQLEGHQDSFRGGPAGAVPDLLGLILLAQEGDKFIEARRSGIQCVKNRAKGKGLQGKWQFIQIWEN